MDFPTFSFTFTEVENEILKYRHLLALLPRSDPDRPALLHQLAVRRMKRRSLLHQKGDLDSDQAITHLTEAILLSLQPSQEVALCLFELASALLSRFFNHRQPEDVKSSVQYFRFLRRNLRSLEDFDIRDDELSSRFFQALAYNLEFVSGDMRQEMEEMVSLIPAFLFTRDVLIFQQMNAVHQAVHAFADAVTKTEIFHRKDTLQATNRAIQMLREATVLKSDSLVSFALARCLAARFQTTHVMNDYEEAIAIADKIFDAHSPGDSLSHSMRILAIRLVSFLLVYRLNSYSRPEYFEEVFHRIRTFLSFPGLPDGDRTTLTTTLDGFAQRRIDYFGITGNSGETRPNLPFAIRPVMFMRTVTAGSVGRDSEPMSRHREKEYHLREILTAILNNEITDVEAAVERSRKLLPLQKSSDDWPGSFGFTDIFAGILFFAYQCTEKSDYLNEAITLFRDLRNMSAPKVICFQMGYMLLRALITRSNLFHLYQDRKEYMQLFPELSNDGSGEVFTRFKISSAWAWNARVYMHPSISIAYEMAMSLLQETLFFSPTLQTQHLRLAHAFREGGGLPSDYASYQIEKGQFKQAIVTLERGRALLWSEMRGLRTYTDRLREADPALADKYADINQRLESVTMSVAQSDDNGDIVGDHETGIGHCESIGHLVLTQRRLLEERNSLISHIQSIPGLENFLKLLSFDVLSSAAARGPVIIINQSQFPSHIIIILKELPPSVISTPSDFRDRAIRLKNELLHVRKEKGLDSEEYGLALGDVLAQLYALVGKPVLERLRQLQVPEKSRVWWCPSEAFCSLPLHAMGPIPSNGGKELYFSDLYIPSYTPTLSALIESQKLRSLPEPPVNMKPSILLVAQPDTLPGAWGEIRVIKTTEAQVTTLVSAMATPKTVIEGLKDHRFTHFVCHGLLETGKPFDASLELHGDNLTLLEIVRSQLPAAEFAFLAACHTAELTEDSVDDEGLHLAAAMQFCGFRSVVGTMWAMSDMDGAELAKHFYKAIFSDNAGQDGVPVPYHERSARALQVAVKKLRRVRGVTLERWVNFVHYGA